ncbi:fasciclin domain-containing protein [Brevundimonas sp. LjRoot202]|uniref:fasciclin domain-containing protein n=1 Tax=Brevundimonas sp. LjRoot202 TaxID=3342281 RepID=UPI003ECEE333
MPSIRPILAALSALALTLAACDRGETPPAQDRAEAPTATPATSSAGTVLMLAQRDPDLTTLVSAIQTAGMEETLNGAGPFTVFAPNNAAFEKIPAARRDALTAPEGRADLRRLLTYHVIPARLEAAALIQRIQAGGGSLVLTTMQGGTLTARTDAAGSITLTDGAGEVARVVEADMIASNGVVHAVDTVAEPR